MSKLNKIFADSFDNKSIYPSLDNMNPHKVYAITINPVSEMELKLIGTRERMINIILPLFHGNVKVYTELSTKSQNVHYHGTICWDNFLEISKYYLNINDIKKECQFKIDILNNPEEWIPYCVKSCPHMDAICHSYKIPNILKYTNKNTIYNKYNK